MQNSIEQCQEFLVRTVKENPAIINNIWQDTVTAVKHSAIAALWDCEEQFSPTQADARYMPDEYWDWSGTNLIPTHTIAHVWVFCLAPMEFEDSVKFLVLELVNGELVLGDYVGD